METSLPLDFGATPVNESKVETWLYFFYKNSVSCIKDNEVYFAPVPDSGQDVHPEEPLFISSVCRDSNPVLVFCPPGGLGPPDKMVSKCLFVP